jgi:hypothetical protein
VATPPSASHKNTKRYGCKKKGVSYLTLDASASANVYHSNAIGSPCHGRDVAVDPTEDDEDEELMTLTTLPETGTWTTWMAVTPPAEARNGT